MVLPETKGDNMKNWTIEIKVIGLGGESVTTHTIKAKTEKVALRKAYEIIGNQTGEILSIKAA